MLKKALIVFILLSIVSLLGDLTYEGGGSVLGSYLEYLGASAILTGLLGVTELVSYTMRLVGGVIATRYRSSTLYWGLTALGYASLLAIPALALTGNYALVLLLITIERMGKGIRAPVRDVILAEVTQGMGRGLGFGLHELADQIGAFAGPAVVAYMLYTSGGDYRAAFSVLAIPAVLAVAAVLSAAAIYPRIRSVESKPTGKGVMTPQFRLFLAGASLAMLGFPYWRSIVGYHMGAVGFVPDYMISLFYTLAMGVDAAIAVPIGLLYDREGLKVVAAAPLFAAPVTAFLFLQPSIENFAIASALWGAYMAVYETVLRASVADLIDPASRAWAYGIFSFTLGASWMASSIIMSALYQLSPHLIVPYSLACEAGSLVILLRLAQAKR